MALIGSTTEPNARNSSTSITVATIRAIIGSRSKTESTRSTVAADAPPTRTRGAVGHGYVAQLVHQVLAVLRLGAAGPAGLQQGPWLVAGGLSAATTRTSATPGTAARSAT